MLRLLIVSCVVAVALARCDCGSEPGPTDSDPPLIPIDTTNTAIDSTLFGVWHRYDGGGALLQQNCAWITADSIAVNGQPTLTGVVDDDPTVGRALIAGSGQIYVHPLSDALPDQYFYDYTLISGTLYLLPESTPEATEPTGATPGVYILRRGIDTIVDLNIITDSLVGTWDEYDSTGSVLRESNFLVVTAESIRYRGTITWQGALDTIGTTGRTLIAETGLRSSWAAMKTNSFLRWSRRLRSVWSM